MPSPRRDNRSRSHSPKSKRGLDLVSTRRYSPPNFRGRGRGRGRGNRGRPWVRHDNDGMTVYTSTAQRYYPKNDRSASTRDDSRRHSHRSRSRSREKSRSRDRQRRSRSSSSGSRSHSKRSAKEKSHSRSSLSPRDSRPAKKKQRGRSEDDAPEARPSRSYKARSPSPEPAPSKFDKYAESKRVEREGEVVGKRSKKYRSASRSPDDLKRQKKTSASETAGLKKEVIPRNRLHKIFSLISQDAGFELDEDISIAIQRNPYAEPSEDSTVTVVFDDALFNMIYPYEGRKHRPIFEREEIKIFGHDKNLADDPDFERRVIRVKPGKSSTQSEQSSSYKYGGGLEITRTVNRGRSPSPRSRRSRSPSPVPMHETKFRLRLSTDPRFESRFAEIERGDPSGSSGRDLDPFDLRHELRKTSGDARGQVNRERDVRDRDRGDRERERDPRDVRRRSADERDRGESKKDKEELPDFSRRKDKYQYTPWLDQPEIIPRDPRYFEHDDRDTGRGRGRGMFRGQRGMRRPFRSRGGFRGRGPYRGRGNYFGGGDRGDRGGRGRDRSPRSPRRFSFGGDYDREWKHDKFSELEHDGDKKEMGEGSMEHPHSTSER